MTNIYPFKAIIPSKDLDYSIHNRFVCCDEKKFNFGTDCHEEKLIYISDLLKQDLLYEHTSESFYCCKISNDDFSVIGLIALVDSSLVDRTIFKHERCIDIKEKIYVDYFKRYKTQISPVILIHEDKLQINRSLNNVISQNSSLFSIKDNEYKYEIWPINDFAIYKKLYGDIGSFFIVDGHHRVSAINSINKNKLMAVCLISMNQIKSENIYREYFEVSDSSKNKILSFLFDNFSLIKTNKNTNLSLSNEFLFKLDSSTIYKVKNYNNDFIRRNILEFLDSSINYKNNKLNFYNYSYNRSNNLLSNDKNNFSLVIPAFKLMNNIEKVPFYPPHSTLFYPKLPDGLVSFYI